MNINKYKKSGSKFNKKTVSIIINDVEEKIKSNVGALHLAVNKDNDEYSETEVFSTLVDTIDRIKKEDWVLGKNSKNIMYEGTGNIAVISESKPEICLYMILKALKTNNSIAFFIGDKIHETSKMLIQYIDEICKKNKYEFNIDFMEYKDVKQVIDYADYFNTYIFINKSEDYFKFTEKVYDKNVIYSSYGTMSLYLDDKNLKDELLKMDEFVFNNNIDLDLIKDMSVEEAVEKINKNIDNYSAIIFTKDNKKAYYFIENTKAKQIFINKNPYKEYLFDIEDEKLTKFKKIYI